ncbi:hypothetical protein PUNSTDRAFT_50216 [Punctularia strigosozonata HHB-11173 SS5]|uniref:uncharacterized protein n=1 Tax=Punctularia strigosozonata (strain HHB-11173) TaxID=741275 RepID=UPI00044163EE|nr:uncharacterized protein PUNSTDRAFT_50216 [Punctularia strigosozonata HHB-11173 SS5]EIN13052.1 hypothetical protein PUNSTDRAFT_50216 [Punctularia strigosozonata HHB-11173 SS5]
MKAYAPTDLDVLAAIVLGWMVYQVLRTVWRQHFRRALDLTTWSKDTIRVERILCYPIKSARGIDLQEAELGATGLQYDRQWAILDKKTLRGVTGANTPQTVLVQPSINRTRRTLEVCIPSRPDLPSFSVPLAPPASTSAGWAKVRVNKPDRTSAGEGYDALIPSEEANDILSQFFERDCILVMKGPEMRLSLADPDGTGSEQLQWQDKHHFLITSVESCRDVLGRTLAIARNADPTQRPGGFDVDRWGTEQDEKLFMERFRPNIVVSGVTKPFAEDAWAKVSVGGVTMTVVSRCDRCIFTTADLASGEYDKAVPLKVMQPYRRVDSGSKYSPCFGVYAKMDNDYPRTIRVQDVVEVLREGKHTIVAPPFYVGG